MDLKVPYQNTTRALSAKSRLICAMARIMDKYKIVYVKPPLPVLLRSENAKEALIRERVSGHFPQPPDETTEDSQWLSGSDSDESVQVISQRQPTRRGGQFWNY